RWHYRCDTLVGGDGRSVSIAAASIVAKVTRDRHMLRLHERYPDYGWHENKGYPTRVHREAVTRVGVTIHHRRSFAPVRNACEFGDRVVSATPTRSGVCRSGQSQGLAVKSSSLMES